MNEEGIKVSARPILVLTCFCFFLSGFAMQRTPPKDNSVRDLSQSIIVPEIDTAPVEPEKISISGVHTGTRSKTMQKASETADPNAKNLPDPKPAKVASNQDHPLFFSGNEPILSSSVPVITENRLLPSVSSHNRNNTSSFDGQDEARPNVTHGSPEYINLVDELISAAQGTIGHKSLKK